MHYRVKPMNCPTHALIFRSQQRSYRELPIRLSEVANVYRNEKSGTLHGLLRVRGLSRTTPTSSARWIRSKTRSSSVSIRWTGWCGRRSGSSSTSRSRPAPGAARRRRDVGSGRGGPPRALEQRGCRTRSTRGRRVLRTQDRLQVPRLDRAAWQGPTIQLDFNAAGAVRARVHRSTTTSQHRPVMIHRAIYGSLERFIGHPDRALRRRVPGLAGAGAGARDPDLGRPGGRRALIAARLKAGHPCAPRRPQRDAQLSDSRRRGAEGAVHGGGRPTRGRERQPGVAGARRGEEAGGDDGGRRFWRG